MDKLIDVFCDVDERDNDYHQFPYVLLDVERLGLRLFALIEKNFNSRW